VWNQAGEEAGERHGAGTYNLPRFEAMRRKG
jgi:hypothetical protein